MYYDFIISVDFSSLLSLCYNSKPKTRLLVRLPNGNSSFTLSFGGISSVVISSIRVLYYYMCNQDATVRMQ